MRLRLVHIGLLFFVLLCHVYDSKLGHGQVNIPPLLYLIPSFLLSHKKKEQPAAIWNRIRNIVVICATPRPPKEIFLKFGQEAC